jgi:serine/threonine-protein kinase
MATGDAGGTGRKRRLVAGRYELLFELARGGMGVVHVAKFVGAHGFDRLVAIKELLDPDDDPRARESFLDEARVTAKIHHPNVLPTLELFEHEGLPFIVMDLVRGVSLWQLLARLAKAKELPNVDLSAWILMHVASGLHAAHELCDASGRPLGLVHRDVSPQNILLGFDGRVCVADFGIAKLRRATVKTESGMVKGKFAYMSPEQARGLPLDRRSDVFSLGVVLHEALTGQRLFDHDSPTETLLHIVGQPVPTPRSIRPDVPEELSAIAMQCLAKAPDERLATADALARALRSVSRTRQADADEQTLRDVLARVHSSQRDALTERLSALAPADVTPQDPAQAKTTIDAMPPVFTPGAAPSAPPALATGGGLTTPARAEIPLRRLPRAVTLAMLAVGALVIVGGAYVARRSLSRTENAPAETHAAAAPSGAGVSSGTAAATAAAGRVGEAASSPSVALPAPAPAPTPATAPATPARTAHPRRAPTAPTAPTASPASTAASLAPSPAPSSSSSKGVPFRAF